MTDIGKISLIDYIESTGIAFKIHGDEIALQYCPYCEDIDKSDYSHFYFNQEKQTFFCQKCGARGNLYRFMSDRGDLPNITKAISSVLKRPKVNPELTSQTDKFYAWYEKHRGISPEILNKYKVGFQIDNANKVIIVYQYFNEKNLLINRKYRNKDKKFWVEKDAEINFYGLHLIDFNKSYVYVCEGEDDCHALMQLNFDNCLSVPMGAGNYSQAMDMIINRFSIVILLFDNDLKGQTGAKNFAVKAGMTKCQNVSLPFKDARECLLQGLSHDDIMTEISKAEYFKHEEIIKANDLKDGFMKYIKSGERLIGRSIRIPEFNRIIGGIRESELTILTGHTGRGKSTFALNFIRWAEEVGFVCMIMSFENKISSVIHKLIEIYSEEQIRTYKASDRKWRLLQNESWIESELSKLHNRDIYFLNKDKHSKDGYFDLEHMGQVIDYAVKFFNVNVFVIDHLHYFLKVSDTKNPVYKVDEAIRHIKQWTLNHNIHILLVVHPHALSDDKKGNPSEIGLNSLKSSSAISQEGDNFWVVSRKEEDETEFSAKLKVLKNREMGRLGIVNFRVLDNLNTYVPD